MSKSKQIAKLLKADISMTSDLAEIAKMLESKGRGGDTMLAHITKREAEMLKSMGGSGTINPETGLLEFDDTGYLQEAGQLATPDMSGFQAGADISSPYVSMQSSGSPAMDTQLSSFPGAGGLSEPAPVQIQAQPVTPVAAGATPATPVAPGVTAEKPFDIGFGPGKTAPDESAAPDWLKKFTSGLSTQDMIRLGLAGGLGILGQQQAKKAADQGQQAAAQQQAIAAPYQAQGQELIRAAQAGELTPTGQQSLKAVQAQVAQGVENRGGVGAAQAAAQVEAFRQQLLQQQYNYGLQIAQVGDSIALGAIKTGLAADQQVQQATNQFYTSLASVAAGLPLAGYAQRTAQGVTQ